MKQSSSSAHLRFSQTRPYRQVLLPLITLTWSACSVMARPNRGEPGYKTL